jgi:hypothetical protein
MGCAQLRSTSKHIITPNPLLLETNQNKPKDSDFSKINPPKEINNIKHSSSNTNLIDHPSIAIQSTNTKGNPITLHTNKRTSFQCQVESTESMKLNFKSSTNLLSNTTQQKDSKDIIGSITKINKFVISDKEKVAIKTSLSNHFLFKDKTIQVINILIDNLIMLKLTPGTTLFKIGEKGTNFYIIKSGVMELITENNGSKILCANDTFGELALIESKKRTATVKSIDECYLYSLSGKLFRDIVTKINESELKSRLTFLKIVPIFSKHYIYNIYIYRCT